MIILREKPNAKIKWLRFQAGYNVMRTFNHDRLIITKGQSRTEKISWSEPVFCLTGFVETESDAMRMATRTGAPINAIPPATT